MATAGPHPGASQAQARPPSNAGAQAATGSGPLSQAPSSTSIFENIWTNALREYKEQTGDDLDTHPLHDKLKADMSVEKVTEVLDRQVRDFKAFRERGSALVKRLKPLVGIVLNLSDIIGGGISQVRFCGNSCPSALPYASSTEIFACKDNIYWYRRAAKSRPPLLPGSHLVLKIREHLGGQGCQLQLRFAGRPL